MAEQTLLQIVQNILSAMSSDQVNSISDTPESLQVAQIVQNKYYDIVARGDLELDEQLFQLVPSNNSTQPTIMSLPAGVARIDWLQYYDTNPLDNTQTDQFGAFSHNLNTDLISTALWTTTSTTSNSIVSSGTVAWTVSSNTLPVVVGQTVVAMAGTNNMFGNVLSYSGTTLTVRVTSSIGSGTFNSWVIQTSPINNSPPGYKYVDIVPIDYFLNVTNRFDVTQSNVLSYTFTQGGNTYTFRYTNNHTPSLCTVLSNEFVLFDSFDNSQDNTLQASKTLAYGQIVPPFLLQDNFIPTLDDQQFPLLLNESKSLAFYELKQMSHTKADQEIQRQWAVTQARKSKANKPGYFDQLANYGRVPRTGGYGGYPLWRWIRNSIGNSGV
jgi:hypothetical protein